jgi:hypothetical protein
MIVPIRSIQPSPGLIMQTELLDLLDRKRELDHLRATYEELLLGVIKRLSSGEEMEAGRLSAYMVRESVSFERICYRLEIGCL